MDFSLANPTKKVTVSFSIDKVKQAIKDLPLLYPKYNLTEEHDIVGSYKFDALEFLSLGVFIDVNLNEVSENKTEIAIEVRRKVGTFDEWYEVSRAGEHLNKIINGIGEFLKDENMGNTLRKGGKSEAASKIQTEESNSAVLKWVAVFAFIIIVGVIALASA